MVRTKARAGAAHFRWRTLDGRHLVTTELGDFLWLDDDELAQLTEGRVPDGTPLHRSLAEKGLLDGHFDVKRAIERLSRKMRAVRSGPNLHVLVVTLRCNHTCRYCHASRAPMDRIDTDMTPETADRVLDTIFATPNKYLTIEFQGGEPLANFDVVRHVIEGARDRNRSGERSLSFALVTNLSLMNEERLAYLVDRRVQICTSLDGPEDIHNHNRLLPRESSFHLATKWIRRINEAYEQAGLDPTLYRVEALPTVTRAALPRWKELVDTYVEAGCRSLFLRPLDPFGFASHTSTSLGYPVEDFLVFFQQAVDYMIELNLQGIEVLERNTALFLTKIIAGEEPNFLDIRSPCGAGIGQVAYNYNGAVYTCDEGRMVTEMGDDAFRIGDVAEDSWPEMVAHPTVRSMVLASTLDGQPGCVNCAYKPYCGVCPVYNYAEHGSIHGRTVESTLCKKHMGIQDYLFRKLRDADRPTLDVLRRWTTVREQVHFIQDCAG